jgi:hypothetical protein
MFQTDLRRSAEHRLATDEGASDSGPFCSADVNPEENGSQVEPFSDAMRSIAQTTILYDVPERPEVVG